MNALILVTSAVLSVLAPVAGIPSGRTDTATADGRPEVAQRLQAEAFALFNQKTEWRRAALLFEQSAQEWGAADTNRPKAFTVAANIYAHLGALNDAQKAFQQAAESAAGMGAVKMAAHAYLDAAEVAVRRGESGEAQELVQSATLLSSSPHLSHEDKRSILARLPGTAVAN